MAAARGVDLKADDGQPEAGKEKGLGFRVRLGEDCYNDLGRGR